MGCGSFRCVRLLRQYGIDARHHFLGHQDHRSAPELAILPVLAGVEQGAELADFSLK
jgi:hypothetical protein